MLCHGLTLKPHNFVNDIGNVYMLIIKEFKTPKLNNRS